MSVSAQFLINDNTGIEQFVVNLPVTYDYAPGERLVTRQVTEAEYQKLVAGNSNNIKIYRYTDTLSLYFDLTKPPKGLNYKIGLNTRLYSDPLFTEDGFLSKMDYYSTGNFNSTLRKWEFADKILTVTFDYVIDPTTKFVFSRNKTITWYKEDGTAHPEKKIMFKNYSPIEMDDEAIQRRKNIIAMLKVEIAGFLYQMLLAQYPDPATRPNSNDIAKQTIAPLNASIMGYINGGDTAIKNVLIASKDPILNTVLPGTGKTVKQYVADRIK